MGPLVCIDPETLEQVPFLPITTEGQLQKL